MQLAQVVVLIGLVTACLAFTPNRTEFGGVPRLNVAGEPAKRSADIARREVAKKGPFNVILLLIDGLGQSDIKRSLVNAESFPVQSSLKVCTSSSSCECESALKANLGGLLSWAQDVKEMSTSALSESTAYTGWEAKKDSENRVSDVLTRLRETMFRTLLKSLGSQSSEPARRSFQRKSDFHELAARTLEDLDTLPNARGFLLVASTGAAELDDALGLVRHFVPSQNSLVIVTGSCPRDNSGLVPVFARGPGSERLASVQHLAELPVVVRNIINELAPQPQQLGGRLGLAAFEPLATASVDLPKTRIARDDEAATPHPNGAQDIHSRMAIVLATCMTLLTTCVSKF
ncbi:hypothetical protein QAD02_012221 [Eretmocerus hayati]|uniref:Uncharacterized protein n=1 Tax=Eretmocerus hayati TaxID=131215 RepID=A0ACC2NYU8_9HYME|nr:hypothetical protein QAD02_012221 [Eretmocerus hayati]